MNHTYQKNKILCVLQVRGGSKGVPKKNIREVNGKPLMNWTIESAKKSGIFESIWVSSDSDETAAAALDAIDGIGNIVTSAAGLVCEPGGRSW